MTTTRIHSVTIGATLILALAVPATARSESDMHHGKGQPTKSDASGIDFMHKAAMGGMAEVQLGRLAEQKAASPDVKAFGKRMVDDHGKANEDLKRIAAQKSVSLPKDLDPQHQALYDRLSKLSGPEFDRAYVSEMLEDHRTDVAEFERATKSSDAEVQQFATRTLPVIQAHLRTVEQLASSGERRSAR